MDPYLIFWPMLVQMFFTVVLLGLVASRRKAALNSGQAKLNKINLDSNILPGNMSWMLFVKNNPSNANKTTPSRLSITRGRKINAIIM